MQLLPMVQGCIEFMCANPSIQLCKKLETYGSQTNLGTYMSNTVESTLFVRMEWIRNLIRISDSTAFLTMLSNLLRIQSYEWGRFVT